MAEGLHLTLKEECSRVASFNTNDIDVVDKSRAALKMSKSARLNGMGIQGTYLKRCQLAEFMMGNECEMF